MKPLLINIEFIVLLGLGLGGWSPCFYALRVRSRMIELLVTLNFVGLIVSSLPRCGPGNPFQVYFFIWFLVFFIYRLTERSWMPISFEVSMAFLVITLFWIGLCVNSFFYNATFENMTPFRRRMLHEKLFKSVAVNKKVVDILQIGCLVVLPMVFLKAEDLSGSADIFSIIGYTKLRSSINSDTVGYGWLSYFLPMSFVVSSTSMFLFINRRISTLRLIVTISASLAFAFLSTGRTFFALLFAMHVFPLYLVGKVRLKGLLASLLMLVATFIFVATMTSKGIDAEDGFSNNSRRFIENLRAYTIAPLVAFSLLSESSQQLSLGQYSFRTGGAVLYALGISSNQPTELVRDFVCVPDETNVYTVYDPYFRDFGVAGFSIVVVFIGLHTFLYHRAMKRGGIFIFFYSASLYPLAMQFFQDQYFSLFSMWTQIYFWYWLTTRTFLRRNFIHGVQEDLHLL